MKTEGRFWWGLSALAMLLVGCGQGAVGDGSITTLSTIEADGLPHGCDRVLDSASDDELAWARVAANEIAIVIDGPDGSCVDDRDHVLEVLESQQRFDLSEHIVADFGDGDPSPHPDLNDHRMMGDPSPHPDKPTSATEGDPSPHPDTSTSSDDDDDGFAVVIVIQIGGGSTGGSGAPTGPAPAPPTPGKDD